MFDLIYTADDARDVMRKEYPEARFQDASDMIHEERFSFEVPDEGFDLRRYYRHLIRNGLALVSLNFQMGLSIPGDNQNIIKELMAELAAIKMAKGA